MKLTRTIEVYPDQSGAYRWRIKARNGRITATSGESYASKRNAWRSAHMELRALITGEVRMVWAEA